MRTLWWKEENCPTPKKALERQRNPAVNGLSDDDTFPRMKVTNCLQMIGSKTIIFENASPPEKVNIDISNAGKVC